MWREDGVAKTPALEPLPPDLLDLSCAAPAGLARIPLRVPQKLSFPCSRRIAAFARKRQSHKGFQQSRTLDVTRLMCSGIPTLAFHEWQQRVGDSNLHLDLGAGQCRQLPLIR